jgi:nicotinamidase-related amidase
MPLPRSPELLSKDKSRLVLVDMQERIVPVIHECDSLTKNCETLIRAANLFSIPVSATEQYPKGLGPTVEPLASLITDPPEKLEFSCLNALTWADRANDDESRFQVVVCGIESHVCVLQTVLDLLSSGFRVYVAADAVSSRKPTDKEFALRRMESSGAIITSTESVVFEWCERAGSPEFKQISNMVK